jgi:hypothetical protein
MQIGYGKAQEIEGGCDTSISPRQDCGLHPLIHTYAGFNLPPDIEKKSGA